MILGIILDVVVALMLGAAIGYAYRLERRLRALHADRAALEGLIAGLAETSSHAEAGVAGLRAASDRIGAELQQRIERADALRDDLGYMLERGGQIADRLEQAVRAGREAQARAGATEAPAEKQPAGGNRVSFPSRIERELRRVVEARR
jgi:hypothetical protein